MKKHYYLVCGTVVFHTQEGEAGQILLNAVIHGEFAGRIPARAIGRAQQALQIQFFKKLNDETATVIDVPIQNMIYLGEMTEEEFNAAPEGTTLQERSVAGED